jgi:type II restriction enzyme
MIFETRQVLEDVGMDNERSNERSAMTLLALAHLDAGKQWHEATNGLYTTRQIMDWINDRLGVEYAPNTRETIRRQTLHQFIAGGLVEENADRPNRPTNSPKWNYRIAPDFLRVVRSVGTIEYNSALAHFTDGLDTWREQQEETREMNKVPVSMPDGSVVRLSAGGQNTLIKAMVEEFCPRFVPGGVVLYIDDTDKNKGAVDHGMLLHLGIEIPKRGKAPDLIVFDVRDRWLFLMEACSTHGPIDVTRKIELRHLFASSLVPIVYVSCFPDRGVMRQYLADLAWETEAWVANNPDHMIHLDGEKFLGPYE